jgi:hypothetical protein
MSKLVKFFAILILLAGSIAIAPGTASAQRHHGGGGGHWHGGGHAGGGWHRGGGWGSGIGFGFGMGYPYAYYPQPYYVDPGCGWSRVRVLRNGRWVLRRAWRCW